MPRPVARRGDNPFEVLELAPGAAPLEIERQKQKLRGMLELGLDAATRYQTPLGERERTADMVREAAEILGRPTTRLAWELWTPRGSGDTLDGALELHAALERQLDEGLAITAAELDELGLAWDLAFESEDVDDRIRERAAELDIDDDGAVLDAFTGELEESLLAMVGAIRVDLDGVESELLERVADRHANEEIERLELSCERYVEGSGDIDAWSSLCSQYWEVVKGRGDHVRSTAFYAIYAILADHAIDLYHAGDYETAARQFRWLSERAEAIGDDDAATRERQNAELSAGAWLRDGQVAQQAVAESSGGGGASWSWFWIVGVLVIALLRAGRGCDSHRSPSYTPPPIRLDNIERINRDLQRSLEQIDYSRQLQRSVDQINRDLDRSVDEIERDLQRRLDEIDERYPDDRLDGAGDRPTTDGQRTESPPAVEAAEP